jgi:hypothetical protein
MSTASKMERKEGAEWEQKRGPESLSLSLAGFYSLAASQLVL